MNRVQIAQVLIGLIETWNAFVKSTRRLSVFERRVRPNPPPWMERNGDFGYERGSPWKRKETHRRVARGLMMISPGGRVSR